MTAGHKRAARPLPATFVAPTAAAAFVAPAAVAALVAIVTLILAGCGGGRNGGGERPELVVSAASSLQRAFGEYAIKFDGGDVRMSFAGSDELAAQIEHGVRPDVFAAANTKLPRRLYAKGLVEKPVVFAANRLVIAVPAGDAKVRSIEDLSADGLTIAAGSPSVPIGEYTRKSLARLNPPRRDAIVGNIRSNEPDAKGIIGKLTQGAVDVGFVYITDVNTAGGKLEAIELPARLQPSVAYAAAVVKNAEHPRAARAFVDGLLTGPGRRALAAAGFAPPKN